MMNHPAFFLPKSSVVAFLAGAIGIPETAVVNAWKVLKHEVWEYGSPDEFHAENEQLFREHSNTSLSHVSAMYTLFLPVRIVTAVNARNI